MCGGKFVRFPVDVDDAIVEFPTPCCWIDDNPGTGAVEDNRLCDCCCCGGGGSSVDEILEDDTAAPVATSVVVPVAFASSTFGSTCTSHGVTISMLLRRSFPIDDLSIEMTASNSTSDA